jgi:hypothetical protein
VTGPVLWLPLTGSAPLQPPEAVHDVASLALHVSKLAPPGATVLGAADKLTAGAGMNVTVALDDGLVPPGPVHTMEYSVVAAMAPVC